MEHQFYENTEYYRAVWKRLLGDILSWPESRVDKWIQENYIFDFLDDPYETFYNRTPQYWIVRLLLPEDLVKGLAPSRLFQLEDEIRAMLDYKTYPPVNKRWTRYKEDIFALIDKYKLQIGN